MTYFYPTLVEGLGYKGDMTQYSKRYDLELRSL